MRTKKVYTYKLYECGEKNKPDKNKESEKACREKERKNESNKHNQQIRENTQNLKILVVQFEISSFLYLSGHN